VAAKFFKGVNGMTTVTDENKVVFTFSKIQGPHGGTNTSHGQTPELYYYL